MSKCQDSPTFHHPTPSGISQTPITIFMETIRFLMKFNAVQVRIFGKGQVGGKNFNELLFLFIMVSLQA